MTQYIDIAVNLLSERLKHDIDTIISDAAKQHVSPLIVIASDVDESVQASLLCQQYPQQLFSTAGVHPHQASSWNEKSSETLAQLALQPHVVAMGECGLDYNRDFSPRAIQRQVFAAQLELACQLNMPVLMHCRDAHDDFIAIVNEYRNALPKALLHCFTGTHGELNACLEADLYIGITGWICDERRGQELATLVPLIPNNRIMAETDSPYLLPRSMRPKPKSSKNLPQYLPYIVQSMAQLRQQPVTELAHYCFQNSCDFFGLDPIQLMVDD